LLPQRVVIAESCFATTEDGCESIFVIFLSFSLFVIFVRQKSKFALIFTRRAW
jgi:hypothetical protein